MSSTLPALLGACTLAFVPARYVASVAAATQRGAPTSQERLGRIGVGLLIGAASMAALSALLRAPVAGLVTLVAVLIVKRVFVGHRGHVHRNESVLFDRAMSPTLAAKLACLSHELGSGDDTGEQVSSPWKDASMEHITSAFSASSACGQGSRDPD